MKKLRIIAVLACVLTGCHGAERKPSSVTNAVHFLSQSDVVSLDPISAYGTGGLGRSITPDIYDTLYQYNYLSDPLITEPLLADGMPELSDHGRVAIIHLKKGIHFTDDPCFKDGHGREVVAQDFVYAIKRMAVPRLGDPVWWIFDGRLAGINDFHSQIEKLDRRSIEAALLSVPVKGIQALDSHTLRFEFVRPFPQLSQVLTLTAAAAIPHEAVEAYANEDGEIIDHAVGSGPYRLEEWARGSHVFLSRNPNYHVDSFPTRNQGLDGMPEWEKSAGKPLPLTDRIEYRIFQQEHTRWLFFLKGDRDSSGVPKEETGRVFSDSDQMTLNPELEARGVRITSGNSLYTIFLTFNFQDPIMGKNKLLRQALSMAFDRETYIHIFSNGIGYKMTSIIPRGVVDRDPEARVKYDFDLENAKHLLAQAGYPEGRGLPDLEVLLRTPSTRERQIGEFITMQFARIGVKIHVEFTPSAAYLSKRNSKDWQIMMEGWTMDYPDAENAYLILAGKNAVPGPNTASFQNAEVDRLYDEIAVLPSNPARRKLIHRMEEIIEEEVPWIMLDEPKLRVLVQPWLFNYRPSEVIVNGDKYLWIDPSKK